MTSDMQRHYRQIVEATSDMLVLLDRDLCCRLVNPAYAAFHHATPEQLLGRPLAEIEYPALRVRMRPHLEAGLSGESRHFTLCHLEPSGQERWIEIEQWPVIDPNGVTGLVLSLRDISEVRAVQAVLQAERANLRLLVETRTAELHIQTERLRLAAAAGEVGIWEWDIRTGDMAWDERMYALYGLRVSEPVTSEAVWNQLVPEDRRRVQAGAQRVLDGEEALFRETYRIRRSDGAERIIAARGQLLSNGLHDDQYMIGVSWDITEEHQAREAAESAARIKAEFLAHMSHEIRTPLNALLGVTQLLERETLLAEQRRLVQQQRAAGKMLSSLIDDILDFSKLESGRLRLIKRPFSPQAVLAQIESLFGRQARAKGLDFSLDLSTDLDSWLSGDALRLEQILLNLVSNAVKFTEQGEIRVEVRQTELDADSVRLNIAVRDTGIGIAPGDIAELGQPFSQVNGSITRRFGGTGLGLAISKQLIARMGGVFSVESTPGVGSAFGCTLPFERVTGDVERPAPPTGSAWSDGPRLAGIRCLIADDSDMNRDVLERALVREGALVSTAANGRQALEWLREQPEAADIVLMDVQMPVLDGLTAMREIRGTLGLTVLPIVACSAGVLDEARQETLDAGASDFLAKPVDLDELVAVFLRWCTPIPVPASTGAATRTTLSGGARRDFPEIPGLDTGRAAQLVDHDWMLFVKLLPHWTRGFAALARETRADLACGLPESAARRLHDLQSRAGYLGALELVQTARSLERIILEQLDGDRDALLDALAEQLAGLLSALSPWLDGAATEVTETAVQPTVIDPAKLAALCAALAQCDLAAFALFETLRPALEQRDGREATSALAEHIETLRFEEALKRLDPKCRPPD